MWEFALIGNEDDRIDFEKFKNKVHNNLNSYGGACIIINEGSDVCLLIACPNEKQFDLKKSLDNFIINKILYGYKKNYFEQNLKDFFIEKYQKSAINALVKFDFHFDVMHIFKNLEYQNELRLSSFLLFKLKALTNKWKEICTITKQNSAFLKNETACEELIKFLLKNG